MASRTHSIRRNLLLRLAWPLAAVAVLAAALAYTAVRHFSSAVLDEWLYDAAVSMHRVLTTNPAERRLERLATPTHEDNRVSYGCINLPKAFYEDVLAPTVRSGGAIIYVLPETRPLHQVFGPLPSTAPVKIAQQ